MALPTERVEIDSKGRVLIPSRFRKALSIKTGDTIECFLQGKNSLVLRLLTPEPIKATCLGCGKTEDETPMILKSTDGRYGVCSNCHTRGYKFEPTVR